MRNMYLTVADCLGYAEGVVEGGQFDVLADCAVGQHVDDAVHGLDRSPALGPCELAHRRHQCHLLVMLDMVHYLDHGVVASTALTIALHNKYITLPPFGVIDLIDHSHPRIQEILGVHDVIKPWVDFDVGWEVDDFDVDLFEVGVGGGVGVVEVEGVGDVGVEHLGEGELVLADNVQV